MKKYFSSKKHLLLICLSITACDATQHSLRTADTHISNGYDKLSNKTSGYLFGRTIEPEEPQFQERDSYCYRTQMDILCYDQPQPKMRARLVAAQRTGNKGAWNNSAALSAEPHNESPHEKSLPHMDKVGVSAAPSVMADEANAPKALISGF